MRILRFMDSEEKRRLYKDMVYVDRYRHCHSLDFLQGHITTNDYTRPENRNQFEALRNRISLTRTLRFYEIKRFSYIEQKSLERINSRFPGRTSQREPIGTQNHSAGKKYPGQI